MSPRPFHITWVLWLDWLGEVLQTSSKILVCRIHVPYVIVWLALHSSKNLLVMRISSTVIVAHGVSFWMKHSNKT
jgi:hypothetical protein